MVFGIEQTLFGSVFKLIFIWKLYCAVTHLPIVVISWLSPIIVTKVIANNGWKIVV